MDLNIINKMEEIPESNYESFNKNIKSKYNLSRDLRKTVFDKEWIEVFKEIIPHIDNILRNPNRFIINEEEVVKIELARKTTVESIKHLSKHTNLIQSIDEDTGDVMPSKILNINKEEDYATYENRVIYTLIQNMEFFVHRRKEEFLAASSMDSRDNKFLKYSGQTINKNKNISLEISLDVNSKDQNIKSEYLQDIENIEEKILMLKHNNVYKILEKSKVALVRPPVKKTNRILKNPDFQYAMHLWSYLQDNTESKTKKIEENEEITKDKELKRLIDEIFLLNYLAIEDFDEDELEKELKKNNKKTKEKITDSLLEKLIFVNSYLSEEELKDMLLDKYEKIKYRSMVTSEGIEKIFKDNMDKVFNIIKLS